MRRLFRWWRERRAAARFAAGWDWMAGELLRDVYPRADLEALVAFSFDSCPFDYGAQAALNAWEARRVLEADARALAPLVACCGGMHSDTPLRGPLGSRPQSA